MTVWRRLAAWYMRTFAWHDDLHERLDRLDAAVAAVADRPEPVLPPFPAIVDRTDEVLARLGEAVATLGRVAARPEPVFPAIPVPIDRTDEILDRLAEIDERLTMLQPAVPLPDRTDEVLEALAVVAEALSQFECHATECRFVGPVVPAQANGRTIIPATAAIIRRATRSGAR